MVQHEMGTITVLHICIATYLHNDILPIIFPTSKISQPLLLGQVVPRGSLSLQSMPTLLSKLGMHWSGSGRSTVKEVGLANEESLASTHHFQ